MKVTPACGGITNSMKNGSNGSGKGAEARTPQAPAGGTPALQKNGGTAPGANGEGLNTVGDALLKAADSEDGIAALLRNGAHVPAKAGDMGEEGDAEEGTEVTETSGGTETGESASTDSDADVDTVTETETTESAGPEGETTEDEDGAEPGDEEASDELPAKLQERINRRIGKEVAKRKVLEERLEAAEARLSELAEKPEQEIANGRPQIANANPLEHVTKLSELERLRDEAEQIVEFTARSLVRLKRSPEAIAQELKGYQIKLTDANGEEDYSPERMEEYLSELQLRADQNLRRNIPRRERFLAEKADWDAKAAETFPYLRNTKSKEYQESRRILESFPELKRHPKSEAMIGVYMLGLEELRRRTAEATAAAAKGKAGGQAGSGSGLKAALQRRVPPKLNGSSRVAAPRVDAREARTQSSRTELVNAGGSEDALTKVIGSMLG